MSNYCWVIARIDVASSPAISAGGGKWEELQSAGKLSKKTRLGELLSQDEMPSFAYRSEHDELPAAAGMDLPDFSGAGPCFVSKRVAEVLAKFDLGASTLTEVPTFEVDRATPTKENAVLWNFGSSKDTAVLSESPQLVETQLTERFKTRPVINSKLGDDFITLSKDALNGPEVWVEKNISNGLFISDAVHGALKGRGFTDGFAFRRVLIKGRAAKLGWLKRR